MITLTIPNRLTVECETLAEASARYLEVQRASDEGGSTFPNGQITGADQDCYISYNGRVWAPITDPARPLQGCEILLYCPSWAKESKEIGTPEAYRKGQESVWGKPGQENPYKRGTEDYTIFELGAEIARRAYAYAKGN